MMIVLVGFAMLFSPLSANDYFPAMSKLEADIDTSSQLINLTVTSYLVLQAVAPALFGDLADAVGRRPAFLGMFSLYTAANLGLALQHSFPALLTLRMVQSLGASATVAVSYGLVADIVTAAERGGVIGASMVATNLGPVLGPLIGGAILNGSGSWQWIFWFLLLCGAAMLLSMLLFLPRRRAGSSATGASAPTVGDALCCLSSFRGSAYRDTHNLSHHRALLVRKHRRRKPRNGTRASQILCTRSASSSTRTPLSFCS